MDDNTLIERVEEELSSVNPAGVLSKDETTRLETPALRELVARMREGGLARPTNAQVVSALREALDADGEPEAWLDALRAAYLPPSPIARVRRVLSAPDWLASIVAGAALLLSIFTFVYSAYEGNEAEEVGRRSELVTTLSSLSRASPPRPESSFLAAPTEPRQRGHVAILANHGYHLAEQLEWQISVSQKLVIAYGLATALEMRRADEILADVSGPDSTCAVPDLSVLQCVSALRARAVIASDRGDGPTALRHVDAALSQIGEPEDDVWRQERLLVTFLRIELAALSAQWDEADASFERATALLAELHGPTYVVMRENLAAVREGADAFRVMDLTAEANQAASADELTALRERAREAITRCEAAEERCGDALLGLRVALARLAVRAGDPAEAMDLAADAYDERRTEAPAGEYDLLVQEICAMPNRATSDEAEAWCTGLEGAEAGEIAP